jgi:hypothetical protein
MATAAVIHGAGSQRPHVGPARKLQNEAIYKLGANATGHSLARIQINQYDLNTSKLKQHKSSKK